MHTDSMLLTPGRAALLALVLAFHSLAALSVQSPSATDADALFQSGDWKRASTAYERLAAEHPDVGFHWYRLARSLQELGRFAEAEGAFVAAEKRGVEGIPAYWVRFELARTMAQLGKRDEALEWLRKAAEGGFRDVARLASDPMLAGLRGDARFAVIVEEAKRSATPCVYTPERRQFDFWLGDWEVFVGDNLVGTNRIEAAPGHCLLLENWTGRQMTGTSMNFYDASDRQWKQLWVDSTGNVLRLAGGLKDGAMILTGEKIGRDGKPILNRITWSRLSDGDVRQHWEQSSDGGASWSTVFDGRYRKKAGG